ncbi:carboxymuconolactone decarboxylase family protein [Nocardia sp. alder85J]|uniref:carboxymuconolactone decarboxylase family protein n=1 Tax=Nocardia sp. alder85J TaxID=2862949 RepID=UPI001CD2039E|nr:carboxymuconolactone decarboxylase family protein [Nocardia sp. alder85J]MCX4095636.1 carboxymuconolactone decarboxylase family protein [Nocardia sp. alder85J]
MARLDPVAANDLYPKVTSRFRDGAFSLRAEGQLPLLYGVLGNSPPMLSSWLDFAWSLRHDCQSSRGLRELAILVVGHRLKAPYCLSAHTRMALEEGLSAEQVEAVPQWATSELFDTDQRLVLELAESMLGQEATAEIVDGIQRRFGAEQALELILTIAFYQMVASTTTTLDIVPDDDAGM